MSPNRAWVVSALLAGFAVAAPPTFAQRPHGVEHDGRRDADVRALADEAERLSDAFKDHLNHEINRTVINGTKKEKQFKERASKLENALDDVRSSVRDGRKYDQTRDRLKRALKYTQQMDRDLRSLPFSPMLRDEWRRLVGRLDQLASFYNLRRA